MNKEWFYTIGDEQHGPVGEAELRTLFEQGRVSGSDLVWSEGMPDWLESNQVLGGSQGGTQGGTQGAGQESNPYAVPAASTAAAASGRKRQRGSADPAAIHNPYAAPSSRPPAEADMPIDTWEYRGFKWLVTSYEGRIPRSKYWLGVLALTGVIVLILVGWIALSIGVTEAMGMSDDEGATVMMIGFFSLFAIWHYFLFAVMAKRWHDRGKSGWMCLVRFIPNIGGLWILIECGCMQGTMGANKYGPDPLLGLHR